MKHVLFVLWFPLAFLLFNLITKVFESLASSLQVSTYEATSVVIFIVAAMVIGEITLFLYQRLYRPNKFHGTSHSGL